MKNVKRRHGNMVECRSSSTTITKLKEFKDALSLICNIKYKDGVPRNKDKVLKSEKLDTYLGLIDQLPRS